MTSIFHPTGIKSNKNIKEKIGEKGKTVNMSEIVIVEEAGTSSPLSEALSQVASQHCPHVILRYWTVIYKSNRDIIMSG